MPRGSPWGANFAARTANAPTAAEPIDATSATPSSMRPRAELVFRMRASWPSAQSNAADSTMATPPATRWYGKSASRNADAATAQPIEPSVIWFGVTRVGIASLAMT